MSTELFTLSKPIGAMRVVARSTVGGQLLCRLAGGELRFFMLREQSWEAVGGFLCIDGPSTLLAHGIAGGCITRNGICVLFQSGAMAAITVADIYNGRSAHWSCDADRIAATREMIIERHMRITDFLRSDHVSNGEYLADFITVYDTPTPLSIKTFAGRPKFSIDRTVRPFRSKALPPSEESNIMFALIACLWTMYPPPGIETSWSVDTTVLRLFSETHAAGTMARWRRDGLPIASQLRRWLPFCKQLVLATSYFSKALPRDEGTFAGVHQKEPWIRSRATEVIRLTRMWLDDGMKAALLFNDTSVGDFVTAHEWMSNRRLHFRTQKRARSENSSSSAASCIIASDVGALVNKEISELEQVRTAVMDIAPCVDAGCFDELVHGITSHLRKTHSLTALALRLTELATQSSVIGAQIGAAVASCGGNNPDVTEYIKRLTSDSLQRISTMTDSEILSKGRALTERHVHAVRLIADGVRMLSSC